LKLFPYEKIVLPFYPGDYQNYFLEKIIKEEINYGSAEIHEYDYGYSLNLSINKPVDIDYNPKTNVGVDIGLNVLAWAVALDEDGKFLDEIHFDGGEAGHIRERYQKLHNKLKKSGKIKKVREIGNKEQKWMENKNHNISRKIIEFAEKFKNPIILLENINLTQLRNRVDNPKIHKWNAGMLRDFIEYKAKEAEIKTELINPKNTSRECPKCGYISENNRNGIDFKCCECGYENHSDFVGATNIARKQ
jgi:IS605 OrfB family transposase